MYKSLTNRQTDRQTDRRTDDGTRSDVKSLADIVSWAKKKSGLIQIGVPRVRNADLKLN